MKQKGLLVIFLIAFLFRISLIPVARHGDINNNTSWGQLLLSRGPVNFYEGKEWTYSAPNQPPLYLVTFAITSSIQNNIFNFIHWANSHISVFPSKTIWWFDTWGELYTAKLPGIVADLGIAAVIYMVVKGKKGLILASVWLINPVSWYNSSIWGGTDSIVNLFGLLSLLFLYKRNLNWSSAFFVISVLFKGSLLIFAPLWLIVAFRQKFSRKQWLLSAIICFALIFISVIGFHPYLDFPLWFYRLYTERFLPGEIGTLTANAFNSWWLVSSGKVLDNTIILGIPARTLGIIITLLLAAPIALKLLKTPIKYNQLLSFALLALISFLFMTRIHERYLYPFFPLATISIAFYPWLWAPYILLSLIHLLNLYNLFWAPAFPSLEMLMTNVSLLNALSFLNILVFVVIIFGFFKTKKPLLRGK